MADTRTDNTPARPTTNTTPGTNHETSEFALRRADLVAQIGDSLEQVLAQINALNRNLEAIVEIGSEFAHVEALWSQFETVTQTVPPGEGEQHDTRNGEAG